MDDTRGLGELVKRFEAFKEIFKKQLLSVTIAVIALMVMIVDDTALSDNFTTSEAVFASFLVIFTAVYGVSLLTSFRKAYGVVGNFRIFLEFAGSYLIVVWVFRAYSMQCSAAAFLGFAAVTVGSLAVWGMLISWLTGETSKPRKKKKGKHLTR